MGNIYGSLKAGLHTRAFPFVEATTLKKISCLFVWFVVKKFFLDGVYVVQASLLTNCVLGNRNFKVSGLRQQQFHAGFSQELAGNTISIQTGGSACTSDADKQPCGG